MNLTQTMKYIKATMEEDTRLNSVLIGDVYDKWNQTNSARQYMSAVIDYSSSAMNGDYSDFTFMVYIGNLENKDKSNMYSSISIAENIAENFINRIDTHENDLTLVVPATITPFEQKFEDQLCGVFFALTVRQPIELVCEYGLEPITTFGLGLQRNLTKGVNNTVEKKTFKREPSSKKQNNEQK